MTDRWSRIPGRKRLIAQVWACNILFCAALAGFALRAV
ncbi:MAG: hypothetical protein ACJAVR_000694 [Paracoccaceae bacterium]|jgi:hypothetical protein